MTDVVVENVIKKFGNTIALDDVSLRNTNRAFTTLLGPSGCGKSTLLRCIAGLETPDKGTIYFDGEPVNDIPPQKRNVAMVFQSYALYPNMTAYKNVEFPLKIRHVPTQEREQKVRSVAKMLHIDKLLDRRPSQLSGGEQQRVSLARALVRDPRVFLLDEPLANIDAKLRVAMRAELKRIQGELKVTTIFVTHDQLEAMSISDRIILMSKGKVEQTGTSLQLFKHPTTRFAAEFIGSPAMNFIKCTAYEKSGKLLLDLGFSTIAFPSELENALRKKGSFGDKKELTLGIRPDYVVITKNDKDTLAFAEVSLVEPLGTEQIVHININGANGLEIVLKMPSYVLIQIGEKVGFTFIMEEMCLFDENGEAILSC